MVEKRKEVRYALDDEISLAAPEVPSKHAQVMDISAHGMRVRFNQDLLPGTPVKVRLDFLNPVHPSETPLVRGEAMHRFPEPGGNTWQLGIRFQFTDKVQEKAVLEALAKVFSED